MTVNTSMTTKLVRVKNLASRKVWTSRPIAHREGFSLFSAMLLCRAAVRNRRIFSSKLIYFITT